MKKIITLALGVVAMLTSCQKEEIGQDMNPTTDQVTINLSADDAVATRVVTASTAPTRYIVEVYNDASYTTAANQAIVTPTDGTASLTLAIDRTKDYYFLFWADVAEGADAYTTTSLKAVTLKSTKNPVESWAGKAQILKGESKPTLDVMLSRAVAKIALMETGKILENSSLVMTFEQPAVFNVSDGTVSTTAARTETITNTDAINGTSKSKKLNADEIYVFATQVAEAQTVADITFTMTITGNDAEAPFTVTNVPFQANSKTNITGHYTKLASETFTISCDNDWEATENDKPLMPTGEYKIGDTYSKDGTAIGVVFTLTDDSDNDGFGDAGMVVSLDEATNIKWGSNGYGGTSSHSNGRINMDMNNYTPFPAFEWCHNRNSEPVSYTEDATGVWYLPAVEELITLYNARTSINSVLQGGLGVILSTNNYWSSTSHGDDCAKVVNFFNGKDDFWMRDDSYYVRAIMAF